LPATTLFSTVTSPRSSTEFVTPRSASATRGAATEALLLLSSGSGSGVPSPTTVADTCASGFGVAEAATFTVTVNS